MTYGHLGRSGLLVSRIGLGTMNFGFTVDESSSFDVMDAAIDEGINFFDTADVYGGPQSPDMSKGYGIAEETVGRWLQRSRRRDDTVLATKVYQPMGLGPNDRRLSGLPHPARVRGEPAAAADRSHRPVPDAPRRPGHTVHAVLTSLSDLKRRLPIDTGTWGTVPIRCFRANRRPCSG